MRMGKWHEGLNWYGCWFYPAVGSGIFIPAGKRLTLPSRATALVPSARIVRDGKVFRDDAEGVLRGGGLVDSWLKYNGFQGYFFTHGNQRLTYGLPRGSLALKRNVSSLRGVSTSHASNATPGAPSARIPRVLRAATAKEIFPFLAYDSGYDTVYSLMEAVEARHPNETRPPWMGLPFRGGLPEVVAVNFDCMNASTEQLGTCPRVALRQGPSASRPCECVESAGEHLNCGSGWFARAE